MAIHNEEVRIESGSGHKKVVDAGAQNMILDLVQKYQYAKPIKSTTRELLCNGIDSLSDKKVAMEILSGTKSIEDYFIERDGELYKDSKFDPSYYDLKWLDKKNVVEMTYFVGTEMGKDKVVIRDTGVGLGGSRLEGYFNIGFSTKRLSKLPLGKYGIN